jgi:hypothetical protein
LSTRIATASLDCEADDSFEETGSFGNAFVTSLFGSQLRKLYNDHGDRLFDRNVRLFLGARKGGVNAAIRDTIESETERSNFWAYNNGVTFICDKYEFDGKQLTILNFSIVNGCQTTVSIANSSESATDEIKVLCRFISAPENAIDSIIRYTNSQNPIRLWDLAAQDKLQKRLKKQLDSLPRPYFYILRKGETRQLSSRDREKYRDSPKGPIRSIPHDLNAQYLAAFRGFPAIAYKDKSRIYSSYYNDVFPDQVRPEEIVLVWHAGEIASELVKKELELAAQEQALPRIAILKRGAKFFVVAAMALILHHRNGNTFLNKLNADVAVSNKTQGRLTNYGTIALEWYVQVVSDLIESGNEITTIVRSQESWSKIQTRVASLWKVYSLSTEVMESALPKL